VSAPTGYVVPNGDLVAARIVRKDSEVPTDEWILAYVRSYAGDRHKYTVQDVEDNDEEGPTTYVVNEKDAVPLPLSIPDKAQWPDAEFAATMPVLALFPGTTCFYRATIATPPRARTGSRSDALREQSYLVYFDDDDQDGFLPEREVPARFVLALPDETRDSTVNKGDRKRRNKRD
jgi:SAGA-associated factor 29